MAEDLALTRPFRLLRVDGSFEGSQAVPIDVFHSPDDAMDAAARLCDQPVAGWKREPTEGVWTQVDEDGRGFVIHRVLRDTNMG